MSIPNWALWFGFYGVIFIILLLVTAKRDFDSAIIAAVIVFSTITFTLGYLISKFL